MHTFIRALRAERPLQFQNRLLSSVTASHCDLRILQEGGLYMVIAIHADHFLRNIRIGFHVLPVRRYLNRQPVAVDLRGKIKPLQNASDILCGHRDAEHAVDFVYTRLHRPGTDGIPGVDVDVGPGDAAGAQLLHEMQRSPHSELGCIFIHSLAVGSRRIRDLPECAACFPDIVPCERG